MATASNNKSLYAPSGSTAWTLHIEFTAGTQSVANNTTSITVKGSLKSGGGSFSSGSSNKLTIYWHDNNTNTDTSWGSTSTSAISSGGSISKTVTKTVTHKSDGTLSGYAKVVWSKNDGNSWTPASGNVSTSTKALTTIPRVSTPTMGASSYTVTASSLPTLVVKTNRASTALTHTSSINIGGTSYTMATKSTADSISWAMTNEARTKLLQTIPNATQYTATVTMTTYSGSTSLGSKTCTVVLKLTNSFGPTISAPSSPAKSVEELNPILTSLSGFEDNCVVTNLSNKKVGAVCTANGSSTVAAVTIQNGSKTKSATLTNDVYYAEFTSSELSAANFVATVKDSRGYTASITYTGTIISYIIQSFSSIDIKRVTSTGSDTLITVKGNWFNDSIGNITNNLNVEYQYAKVFDDQTNYVVDDLVFYGDDVYKCIGATTGPWDSTKWEAFNTFTSLPKTYGTGSLKNTFTAANDSSSYMTCEYQYNYKVKIRMQDAINGVTYTTIRTLTSAVPVLWIGERTIRVGGAAIMNYLGLPYSSYISPDGTSVNAGEHLINGDQFTRILKNNGLLNNTGVISTGGGTITVPSSDGVYILFLSGTNDYTVSNKIYMVIPSQSYTICMGEQHQVYSVAQSMTWASGFSEYDSNGRFSRRNGIAGFHLVAKNTNNIAYSTTGTHVCTLNVGLRPRHLIHQIQQGSSNWIFFETFDTDGKIYISRYRNGGADQVLNAGTWINLDIPAYVADDDVGLTISITGTVINIKPKFASLRYHLIRIY